MDNKDSQYKGYILAAGLGAIGGGLLIALATRAIPKMMAGMMSEMGAGGCEPVEI